MHGSRYVLFTALVLAPGLLCGCGGGGQSGPPPKEYATDIAAGNVKPETGEAAISIEFTSSFNDASLANMKVLLLVRDSEGNALFNDEKVTDEHGVARFEGLPAQAATVRAWNPEKGVCEFEVDLQDYTGEKAGAMVHSCVL